jgi:hypothetical protein
MLLDGTRERREKERKKRQRGVKRITKDCEK